MRRLILLNALIFAMLAAAAALAYYGYTATTEQTSRERELALMQDLAEEKVLNIESLVDDADRKLLADVALGDKPADIERKIRASGAAVSSVFVLDDHQTLVPDGVHTSRDAKEGIAFRDWFLVNIIPVLRLPQQRVGDRRHLYLNLNGPYLFSYMRRLAGGRTFYVVIEDDPVHLYDRMFPQFLYTPESTKRVYQVFDDMGQQRYGPRFVIGKDALIVRREFTQTWGPNGFWLRVSQNDQGDRAAQRRKQVIDAVVIAGAVTVILAGLLALGLAIRRERRLNALKSEFISNVSHELKTPLSIISMFGEMLAMGRTKSAEQAHEYAEIIWRESVRLGRLIDNVLDFAKIERGMGAYEFDDEANIAEVLDRAMELSQRRVQAASMTLTATIDEELPPVRLDSNAFTLAVLNLIDNAIKYAADGKTIEVSLKREGKVVVLAVTDHGAGIDPEEHEKIFERFYRAKAIRLKPIRGSGIGLALVQHIALAHGGSARVDSTLGKGSTFSISLPISGKEVT